MRLVGEREERAPRSLKAYFEEIYFLNPWRDPEVPCHVYEDDQGRIAGFLGAMQRPMVFRGQPIRSGVLCGVMVDKIDNRREAATALVAAFVGGPQDLSFTDCAKPQAIRIWESCGGSPALLYCLDWTRVLSPTRHSLGMVTGRKLLSKAGAAATPLLAAVDAMARKMPVGPYRVRRDGCVGEEASDELLLACLRDFANARSLGPSYDARTLAWLLATSAKGMGQERLHKIVVRGGAGADAGTVLGWYMYCLRPGGVANVFQMGGARGHMSSVLNHLFAHALGNGAIAVTGQIVPEIVLTLSDCQCRFRSLSIGMLVHARNPEISNAIQRGDAFLSRTEGEWWIRFPAFA
jgi:hypothetical protein